MADSRASNSMSAKAVRSAMGKYLMGQVENSIRESENVVCYRQFIAVAVKNMNEHEDKRDDQASCFL